MLRFKFIKKNQQAIKKRLKFTIFLFNYIYVPNRKNNKNKCVRNYLY